LSNAEISLEQIFIDALGDLKLATAILNSTLNTAMRLSPGEGNWIISLPDDDLILLVDMNNRGIVPSIDNWRLQRALLSKYYAAIIEHGPDVASYAEHIRSYAHCHFGIFER